MAKKTLINTNELKGKDNAGYRVLEVVDAANTFEVHPSLEWHDCADTVEMNKYWYDPSTNTFKKLPEAVNPPEDYDQLAENYVFNYDTESWEAVV